jgi:hypothetical protein
MRVRLCPRWLYCRILGDKCFHNKKHSTMPSCDLTSLKGNFGPTGLDDKRCPELVVCADIESDVEPKPWFADEEFRPDDNTK